MKLRNILAHANYEPFDSAKTGDLAQGTLGTVVGICLGSAFFIVFVAAVSYYYQRRRQAFGEQYKTLLVKKNVPIEKPIGFRKPTAVRSPNSGTGPQLKKSPSPTSQKSPPGGEKWLGHDRRPSNESHLSSESDNSLARSRSGEKFNKMEEEQSDCVVRMTPSSSSSSPITECNMRKEIEKAEPEKRMECEEKEKEVAEEKPMKSNGTLHFRLRYNYAKQALCVTIIKATNLPTSSKDPHDGTCDPYVKLQLLPEKQHKVKTRVLRKTQNPLYEEDFTFYGITPKQLKNISLHFVVLSFDRYSRDEVIGEDITHLSVLDFDTIDKQIYISKEIMPKIKIEK